ncbi:serine/threonine protein kinase [Nostoc sp. PCC 7524]|uniref:serine/threonine-protein kinase n=1 Tax=Nostoc sp. (strain ATCC 29411 / PCC 7524) TaxID=28072 RepID=UPI00029F31A4|nr:serine/threonine-protein kinase [Nostoc sp. PCC 7524]AFY49609.1 serine/threonine protein kinase [Nostoc sp. PCC 7524]
MELWTPNQTLKNGRFIVQKVLGGGGFGVTYSVLEQRTNKLFAIKTLNPIQQSQGNFNDKQEQFVNEALRLRGCQHPHIVKVYEVIQEAGLWGMVMEYVNGDDLGVYVDQHGHLLEDDALRYINQVGQALESVHQQGFLHRDIKPNNIILRSGTQEAVLIDFGLAREFLIGKTLSMTNSRTEGYAPVEQYERQGHFGTYTDVYGLAATLYSLLTGRTPIPANYRKDGDIPLKAPKQFNSSISDRVNDAIVQGMALEPQDRPQTMREWLELLIQNKADSAVVQISISNSQSKVRHLNLLADQTQLITSKMDYTQLSNLLAAGKWKEADKETSRAILAIAWREKEGWRYLERVDNIPCEDIRIINNLWVKYSNSRFGFSVQKKIFQSVGGNTKTYWKGQKQYQEIWLLFCNHIGWKKDDDSQKIMGIAFYICDINFDLKAPIGHLPCSWIIELQRLRESGVYGGGFGWEQEIPSLLLHKNL